MATQDRPVLVTGGTGFVGSYVVRALCEHGRRVCVFDVRGLSPEARLVLGEHADSLPIEHGSIEDLPRVLEVVKWWRPSQIVHIAARIDFLYLDAHPYSAVGPNMMGTLNVLEAARLLDVERVVNFSSIGVLPTIQYEPIDGAHPLILPAEGPGGAYAAAKVGAEAFCYAYQQTYGLDFRTIRPSAMYGFGMQWHAANYMKEFVEPAVRGEPVRLPSGARVRRDYFHAVDMGSLVVALLEASNVVDRTFYGATGEPLVTAAEVAQIVRELVPGADIAIADAMTEDDYKADRCRGVISIENARNQLGWSPVYRSVRDGIAEYIERYRAFLARGA